MPTQPRSLPLRVQQGPCSGFAYSVRALSSSWCLARCPCRSLSRNTWPGMPWSFRLRSRTCSSAMLAWTKTANFPSLENRQRAGRVNRAWVSLSEPPQDPTNRWKEKEDLFALPALASLGTISQLTVRFLSGHPNRTQEAKAGGLL